MKEILQRLQNKKILLAAVLIGLVGTLFFTGLNTVRLKRENREIKARLDREIQQGIAGEVFRLHVIANSDTEKDQELKLKVNQNCRVSKRNPGRGCRSGCNERRCFNTFDRNRARGRKTD